METSFNLKRREDSGDSDKVGEKKQCKNIPSTPKPKKQQQLEKQKPLQPMPLQPLIGITLCPEPEPSKITDHQLKTILKPLSSIRTISNKNICNPYLFSDAAKVTTFVHMAGNRTRELWRFIQEASRVDLRLAELEHYSLKKCFLFVQAGSRFWLTHPFIGP